MVKKRPKAFGSVASETNLEKENITGSVAQSVEQRRFLRRWFWGSSPTDPFCS